MVVQQMSPADFYHTNYVILIIPLQLNFSIMRTTFPTHQSRNNTSDKLVKLIQGKGYLEIMMYLLAVAASAVILFA
jgi:hypothetical protein